MAHFSPARIAWSPDGARLLVWQVGAIRMHAHDGAFVRELAPGGYRDARWRADGDIIAIDDYARRVRIDAEGGRHTADPPERTWYVAGAIAADGGTFVVTSTTGDVFAARTSGAPQRWWTFRRESYDVRADRDSLAATISADGNRIAIGYAGTPDDARRPMTRGWLVVDIGAPPEPRTELAAWTAPVIASERYEVASAAAPLRMAFDGTGGRLVIASPDADARVGTVIVGAAGPVPRSHEGRVRAVALDPLGIRAAYAYPEAPRVRVDYLGEPAGAVVAIDDSKRIEPDLGDIVALAFSPAGDRLACLGADGRVGIVPVP